MSPQPPGQAPDESRTGCTPCRGTGKVISNLGGTAHELSCPWCDGTGKYVAGRDAQESPAEASSDQR
jgi:DnaJ-class molecular chaperone